MLSFNDKLNNYAKLLVEKGINIQKDQILILDAPIDHKDFALNIAKKAYERGSKYVHINWSCDEATKLRYDYSDEKHLDFFPEFLVSMFETADLENAAYLYVRSPNPNLLSNVDPLKIAKVSKASGIALKKHSDYTSSSKATWCIAQVPSIEWSKKVFPDLPCDEAFNKLYDIIFETTRVNCTDPIKEWENHLNLIEKRIGHLNKLKIKNLKYKSSTMDISLDLPENAVWQGGGENSQKGIYFVANIPTEEVFTLPKFDSVNGVVKSTKPLNYRGNLIENFSFKFENGKVVDFSAEKGEDVLKNLLETDEGSKYLGEIALVPYSSPINQTNTVLYSTLFDENASCHFALGSCYPTNLKDGGDLDDDKIKSLGGNISITHVDFMVGSNDLNILATTFDNKEILIFENGEFTF